MIENRSSHKLSLSRVGQNVLISKETEITDTEFPLQRGAKPSKYFQTKKKPPKKHNIEKMVGKDLMDLIDL